MTGFLNFTVPGGAANGPFQITGFGEGGHNSDTKQYTCGTNSSSSSSSSSSSNGGGPFMEVSKTLYSSDSEAYTVTYAVTVTNTGTGNDPHVVVKDVDFDGQTFLNSSGPLTNCGPEEGNPNIIACDETALSSDESVTQYFTFSAGPCSEDGTNMIQNTAVAYYKNGNDKSWDDYTGQIPWCGSSSS
jgi:hypothetical protein